VINLFIRSVRLLATHLSLVCAPQKEDNYAAFAGRADASGRRSSGVAAKILNWLIAEVNKRSLVEASLVSSIQLLQIDCGYGCLFNKLDFKISNINFKSIIQKLYKLKMQILLSEVCAVS
jgi:hypothetical protein